MQNTPVPHMDIRVKGSRFVREGMDDAVLLNIGSPADTDITDIPSQNNPHTNVGPTINNHIPDQYGLKIHKNLQIYIQSLTFKLIKCHEISS